MPLEEEIFYGMLPLVLDDEEQEGDDGELDRLSVKVLCDAVDWRASLAEAGYVRGSAVEGYHAMYVETIRRGRKTTAATEADVECVGLLEEGEKRRRVIGVAGQQVAVGPFEEVIIAWDEAEQGEDGSAPVDKVRRRVPKLDIDGEVVYKTITTPIGNAERWNIRQAVVTVTDVYFVTSRPDMTGVGTAFTPPNAPAVPAYPWGSYDEPLRGNFPAGWVLDDRQVEELFVNEGSGSGEVGLFAVTDVCGYYYNAIPD